MQEKNEAEKSNKFKLELGLNVFKQKMQFFLQKIQEKQMQIQTVEEDINKKRLLLKEFQKQKLFLQKNDCQNFRQKLSSFRRAENLVDKKQKQISHSKSNVEHLRGVIDNLRKEKLIFKERQYKIQEEIDKSKIQSEETKCTLQQLKSTRKKLQQELKVLDQEILTKKQFMFEQDTNLKNKLQDTNKQVIKFLTQKQAHNPSINIVQNSFEIKEKENTFDNAQQNFQKKKRQFQNKIQQNQQFFQDILDISQSQNLLEVIDYYKQKKQIKNQKFQKTQQLIERNQQLNDKLKKNQLQINKLKLTVQQKSEFEKNFNKGNNNIQELQQKYEQYLQLHQEMHQQFLQVQTQFPSISSKIKNILKQNIDIFEMSQQSYEEQLQIFQNLVSDLIESYSKKNLQVDTDQIQNTQQTKKQIQLNLCAFVLQQNFILLLFKTKNFLRTLQPKLISLKKSHLTQKNPKLKSFYLNEFMPLCLRFFDLNSGRKNYSIQIKLTIIKKNQKIQRQYFCVLNPKRNKYNLKKQNFDSLKKKRFNLILIKNLVDLFKESFTTNNNLFQLQKDYLNLSQSCAVSPHVTVLEQAVQADLRQVSCIFPKDFEMVLIFLNTPEPNLTIVVFNLANDLFNN